jgi:hypothetical protein
MATATPGSAPCLALMEVREAPAAASMEAATADTKNKTLFLMTVEIISWDHKKILDININHFCKVERPAK